MTDTKYLSIGIYIQSFKISDVTAESNRIHYEKYDKTIPQLAPTINYRK